MGDRRFQNRYAEQGAVRDAFLDFNGTNRTDVWLTLGDNAYRRGSDSDYENGLFNEYSDLLRQTCLWPAIGNHDLRSLDSGLKSSSYLEIFCLPDGSEFGGVPSETESYYSFDHGRAHFVCLDSQSSDRSS